MAKAKMLTGCRASAEGAKAAEVEVICSFPIRPYTAIMMELAKIVSDVSGMERGYNEVKIKKLG